MHAYASSHHAHSLAHRLGVFEPPESLNLVADREVILGGLGGLRGHGISWPLIDIGSDSDEGDEGVYLGVDESEPCDPCPS